MEPQKNYADMDAKLDELKTHEAKYSTAKTGFSLNRNIKDILHLLIVNRFLVAAIFLITVLSTTIQQFLIVPRYQTSMLLELQKMESVNPSAMIYGAVNDKEIRIGNILALINSGFIMNKVYVKINKAKSDKFTAKGMSPSVNITPIPRTNLLRLVVSDTDAERTKFIAEVLVDTYLEAKLEKSHAANSKTIEIVSERIEQSKKKSFEIINQINEYYRKNPSTAFRDAIKGMSLNSSKAKSIIELISKQEIKIIDSENRRRTLKKFIKEDNPIGAVSLGFTSPQINNLYKEYNKLDTERIRLSEKFKSRHPKLLEIISGQNNLRTSIKSSLQKLVKTLSKERAFLQKNMTILNKKLDDLKPQLISDNSKHFERVKFEQDLEINKKILLQLEKRKRELELSSSVNEQDFYVVENAQVPGAPYYPKRLKNILISCFVTVILIFVIVMLLDFMSPRIVSLNDLEKATSAPILKSLSKIKRDHKIIHNEELMVFNDLRSYGSEAFRHLRSKVEYRMKPHTKSILISSPNRGDGKTFVSINLAMAFAIKNKKVLLVDADLRKASLGKIFAGLNPTNNGLSDVLTKNVPYKDVVVKTLMNGMHILFSGDKVAYPAETLEKENLYDKFLAKAENDYDYIIIDSPKAHLLSDPLVITRSVDNILIISSYGGMLEQTLHVSSAISEVGGNIIGCVLNKAVGMGNESSYHYYY